ncbi:hypothetical protein T265_01754 [Opisthorchis viverrini]|uniref:TRAFD1/XAF1 zinc finger domain-containing protein n=2 Tax=Opisthorchis viverrini TaxID=6198 RepID=A0A074ZXG1_OPIVI|nr:hypothetical protein T265_01754 [Opisthorchis viverrini]KER32133.1 hypothetical protein T265_01754 [Opisthorchis viverrini]
MRVPKFKMANHQGTCPARPIACHYCELEFPANSYEEHVDRCSSRTELCSGCGKFVMLRDLQTHACVLSYPFENGTKKPEPTGDPDFTSDLELATRLQYMELNQAVSKLAETEQASVNQELPRKSYTNCFTELHEPHFVPCEFCSQLCTVDGFMTHQFSCPENPSSGLTNFHTEATASPPVSVTENLSKVSPNYKELSGKNPKVPVTKPSGALQDPAPSTNLIISKGSSSVNKVTHSRPIPQTLNGPSRPKYELPPLRDPLIRQRRTSINTLGTPRATTSNVHSTIPSHRSSNPRPGVTSQRRISSVATVTVRPQNCRRSNAPAPSSLTTPGPRFPGIGRRLGGL